VFPLGASVYAGAVEFLIGGGGKKPGLLFTTVSRPLEKTALVIIYNELKLLAGQALETFVSRKREGGSIWCTSICRMREYPEHLHLATPNLHAAKRLVG